MKPDILISAGKWFWDNFGKDLVDKAIKETGNKWKSFNWPQAEGKYRSHVRKLYGTTKVLNRDIKIQNLYTDVYVYEEVSTDSYLEANEFQKEAVNLKSFSLRILKKPIRHIALQTKRLFILGKPGSGKTTFLKYLTIKACMGNTGQTPIFISLKEYSDSKLDIIQFINRQFDVCSFPDAQFFVCHLLDKSNAIVLFDGLDEVDVNNRKNVMNELEWFSKKYIDVTICISCRLGSIEKAFDRYTYMEIADFDEKQMNIFARKWFEDNDERLASFLHRMRSPENHGLRELAQTPLLLALLCIVFEETLEFPKKKIDLYMRAVDVLLEKWDSKRGIVRNDENFSVSRMRKEHLLGFLAAINFQAGKFIFEKEILTKQVEDYFMQLPKDEIIKTNGESVLKAIQEHHGLLVQRSQNLYTFSHLTFQEYFTARYIVGNAANGAVNRLIANYWNNDQWREIIKMTFGMLDEGTQPINYFIDFLNSILITKDNLSLLFRWSNGKAVKSHFDKISSRCMYSYLGLIIVGSHAPDRSSDAARAREKLHGFSLLFSETKESQDIYKQLEEIALDLSQRKRISLPLLKMVSREMGTAVTSQDLELNWGFENSDLSTLIEYLSSCKLLLECQDMTRMNNRQYAIDKILEII